MRYAITFQVGGEEQTQEVDAPDAATAAELIRDEQGRTDELFELISVQLLDPIDPTGSDGVEEADSISASC